MSTPAAWMRADRLHIWLPPLLAALLFGFTLWVLHRELRAIHYQDLSRALAELSWGRIALAGLFTAVSYMVLTGYDQLAFRYLRHGGATLNVAAPRISAAAFISYAVSNNVGFSLLSGTAIRHRFYARWGLSAADLSRLVVFNYSAYWLGLITLMALTLISWPAAFGGVPLAPISLRVVGAGLLVLPLGYLLLCARRTAPLRLGGFVLSPPSPGLAAAQIVLGVADWLLAAAVLFLLLPAGSPSYPVILGAFVAAQLLGLISHVPGGLGVFEGAVVLLLGPHMGAGPLITALMLYRLLYYLVPLVLALLMLVADELRLRRARLVGLGKYLGGYSLLLMPRAMAVLTFVAGLLLLITGALPAEPGRLHHLRHLLPLGVFEVSHFIGSVIGVGLLLLSQALIRRLRAAYHLVVAGLAVGIVSTVLKAADWNAVLFLTLLLAVFLPSRMFFDRRAALFEARPRPEWIVAILAALGTSIWIGLFAFQHVEYANHLWWQVAFEKGAPRFLRASLGAAVTLLAVAGWGLLRPWRPPASPPTESELIDAGRVIRSQARTLPYLVYLRDKALLFNDDRSAFIMYGQRGRYWVALGDPVGANAAAAELIRDFIDRADDLARIPVFYQVRPRHLHLYADLGFAFAKLGEEARIPVADFSLSGSRYAELRTAMSRLKRENVGFRVVEPGDVAALLPALKRVSDQWLARKASHEKGFSLGFFDSDYLQRLPVAILERDGRVLAFANLLTGPTGEELSADLMRFVDDAPPGTMDALFTHLFLYARQQGYQSFSLGMAPLSGLDPSRVSPIWPRLGRFIYRHGEAFYHFEGLRAYKEKFHPQWEPRYLAYPSGAGLAAILTDIAALSAGGYLRILR